MDLLKIQLEGRYLGRDIFLFIFYSDSTAFSSTKYVRVSYKRFYVKSIKGRYPQSNYSIFLEENGSDCSHTPNCLYENDSKNEQKRI